MINYNLNIIVYNYFKIIISDTINSLGFSGLSQNLNMVSVLVRLKGPGIEMREWRAELLHMLSNSL